MTTNILIKNLNLFLGLTIQLGFISFSQAGIVSDNGLITQYFYSADQISEVDKGVAMLEVAEGVFIETRATDSIRLMSHQRTWGDQRTETRLELLLGMDSGTELAPTYSQAPLTLVLPDTLESDLEKLNASNTNSSNIDFLKIQRLDKEHLLITVAGVITSFRNGERPFNISVVVERLK